MSRITIRPAQGYDFHPIQAMSCTEDARSCYPSFHRASHQFFVAADSHRIVGYICAYPARESGVQYLQLMKPYVFHSCEGRGIEAELREHALSWGEGTLHLRHYKEEQDGISPMRFHDLHEAHHEIPPEKAPPIPAPIIEEEFAEPVDNRVPERISARSAELAFL